MPLFDSHLMTNMTSLAFLLLLGIGNIPSARTQDVEPPTSPPCPPPGLETVMSTQQQCDCFYAFAASDLEDYQSFYAEDSVLHYPSGGKYFGPGGIEEYNSFITNGVMITNYTRVGSPIFLDVSSTAPGQCKIFLVESANIHANPVYTLDNKEACASITVGVKFDYGLTGNPEKMVSIRKQDVWLSNKIIGEMFPLFTSSTPTAEYVCDQIVNTCKDYSVEDQMNKNQTRGLKSKKAGKKGKATKKKSVKQPKVPDGNDLDMEACVEKYLALPDVTYDNGSSDAYIDGNSKGCRALHSFFASNNDIHCPHITFEAEADINGKFKCDESAGVLQSDLFTEAEIGQILFLATNYFGFDESGGRVQMESCPE